MYERAYAHAPTHTCASTHANTYIHMHTTHMKMEFYKRMHISLDELGKEGFRDPRRLSAKPGFSAHRPEGITRDTVTLTISL